MTREEFDEKSRVPPDNIDTQLLKRILNNVGTREEDTAAALSLIAQGADPNASPSYQTALIAAIRCAPPEITQALLEKGADVSKRNYWNETPLFMAVSRDMLTLAADIIKRGADVNAVHKYNETCLLAAASKGFAGMASLLLENGANTEVANDWGGTPLIAAAHNGHIDALRVLLNAGARADATDNDGRTARDHAQLKTEKSHQDAAKILQEAETSQRRQDHEKLDQWFDDGLPLKAAIAVSPLRRLKPAR